MVNTNYSKKYNNNDNACNIQNADQRKCIIMSSVYKCERKNKSNVIPPYTFTKS